jgi:hypothetical protein
LVVLIVAAQKTDSLGLGTARQVFLDYAQKLGGGAMCSMIASIVLLIDFVLRELMLSC